MKKVVIIGAGGHGRVIADIVRSVGDEVVGFLDDSDSSGAMGKIADYEKYIDCFFVAAIGDTDVRERIVNSLNVKWYTAIHSSASVSPSALVGEGTVVMANCVINAGARVGKHCIINTGAIIEHDNVVEDLAHVSVGVKLGGTVTVGRKTWVGIGATVVNNVKICNDSMIFAGAVVVKNIDEPGSYGGIPASRI